MTTPEPPGAEDTREIRRSQAPAPGPGDPCGAARMRRTEARWLAQTSGGLLAAYHCVRCDGWHTQARPPDTKAPA